MTPDRYEEEQSILQRLRRGERLEPFETIRRRKDGSLIHVSVTISPIKNVEGRIIGASKIARDITKGKQAQETQALLLGEMRHRVNNLFAVTNALVGMIARSGRKKWRRQFRLGWLPLIALMSSRVQASSTRKQSPAKSC